MGEAVERGVASRIARAETPPRSAAQFAAVSTGQQIAAQALAAYFRDVPRPPFRLVTLGRLALFDADGAEEPSLGTRRRKLALLAVLALARRPISRDTLIGMFWPDQPEERARHSLSDALSHLRRVLGPEAIAAHRTEIALADDVALTADARELLLAVAAGRMADAVAHWQGAFLTDVHVPGSPAFAHWADGVRAHIEDAALRATSTECERLAGTGDHLARSVLAERWIDAAPLSVAAATHWLESLAADGTAEAAARALDAHARLVRRLAKEFDTVPDAAVQGIAESLRARVASAPALRVASAAPAEKTASAVSSATTAADAAATPPASAGVSAPLASTLHRSRLGGRIVVAVAGLAALLLIALEVRDRARDRARDGAGARTAPDLLLVGDFETGGLDSVVAVVLAEAVRMGVNDLPATSVVDAVDVRRAVAGLGAPAGAPIDSVLAHRVAIATHATGVVTGGIRVTPAGMLLDAALSVPGGDVIATARAIARDSSELLAAAATLVRQLARRTDATRVAGQGEAEGLRFASDNLDALHRYAEAVRLLDRGGDRVRAYALLEEAVALDTTFSLALRRLALIDYRSEDTRDRFVLNMTRAYRHADRLPPADRELTVGTYHMLVSGDHAKAATAFRARLALRPRDRASWHNLGMTYQYVGDERRAADAYERSLAVDSTTSTTWANLIDAQVALGDTAAAWRAVERMARALPGHGGVYLRSGMVSAASGAFARADSYYVALLRTTPDDVQQQATVNALRASLAWSSGNAILGDSLRRAAITADRARGAALPALRGALEYAAAALWNRRDRTLARDRLRAALAASPLAALPSLDRPWLELVPLQALTGDVVGARASFAAWTRDVPAAQRRQDEGSAQLARGAIAMAERRFGDAVNAYRAAPGPLCPVCGLAELSIAFDSAGQTDSARVVAVRYLATPSIRRVDATDGLHRVRMAERARR